ncbi:MAG: hypothetical protein ACREX4_20620 [Gammaproteobacteria bacterium]
MKLLLASLVVLAALPASAQTVRSSEVTIAMLDTLTETNIAIVVHRVNSVPANVVLVSRRAGPRELAAGLAVYRHTASHPENLRMVVKSTRRLNRVLERNESEIETLERLLVQLRQSTPKPLPGVAAGNVRQVVHRAQSGRRELPSGG